nr:VCBS repeat-containing protein [Pontibacter liquoris]
MTIGHMNPSDVKQGQLAQVTGPFKDAVPELQLQGLRRPVSMTKADLDGDQLEDLIVCQYGNNLGALVWYRQISPGKYKPVVLKNLPGARKAEVTDLNGDGRLDVVAMFAQATESVKVFYNKGNGAFEEKTLVQFPPVYELSYFELVDFNKDGHLDIVLSNGDNADYSPVLKPYHGIRVLLNNGQNTFRESFFYPMPGASKVLARDFDQDGDLDLAAISFFPDFKNAPEKGFVYLQQQSDHTFKASTFPQSQTGHWLTMEAADYDQDNDLDLILGSFIYTPAPPAIQQKWMKEGPAILVLQNNSKQPKSKVAVVKK